MHQINRTNQRGFTVIELLVVVSIIALLVGILLPAIGKAREQAQLTKSNAQMKQLGTAHVSYAAEFADRQLTFVNDYLAKYGGDGASAMTNFNTTNGSDHPAVILGYGQNGVWAFFMPDNGPAGNYITAIPLDFQQRFGAFRIPNARQFNQYLNGRFYDPVFYAPKDTSVMQVVEQWFDHADEYVPSQETGGTTDWSSYCMSPAAMFNPDVLSLNKLSGKHYTNPWTLQAGFRSPALSQASYPDLKTHMIEHNWCQNRKKVCNPDITPGTYDGCEPFYFNASMESAPVTLFYDGHVAPSGQRDAIEANARMLEQSTPSHGLWSIDTPMAGGYANFSNGGYYMDYCLDETSTSYHVLTIDGIRGRDFISN